MVANNGYAGIGSARAGRQGDDGHRARRVRPLAAPGRVPGGRRALPGRGARRSPPICSGRSPPRSTSTPTFFADRMRDPQCFLRLLRYPPGRRSPGGRRRPHRAAHRLRRDHAAGHRRRARAGGPRARRHVGRGRGAAGQPRRQPRRHARPLDQRPLRVHAAPRRRPTAPSACRSRSSSTPIPATEVACIPSCVTPERPCRYEPITAAAFLQGRIDGTIALDDVRALTGRPCRRSSTSSSTRPPGRGRRCATGPSPPRPPGTARCGRSTTWPGCRCAATRCSRRSRCSARIAASTTTIELGVLVANVFNRTPALLGVAAATLEAIADRPVHLGLGAGAAPDSRWSAEMRAIGQPVAATVGRPPPAGRRRRSTCSTGCSTPTAADELATFPLPRRRPTVAARRQRAGAGRAGRPAGRRRQRRLGRPPARRAARRRPAGPRRPARVRASRPGCAGTPSCSIPDHPTRRAMADRRLDRVVLTVPAVGRPCRAAGDAARSR